MIRHGPAHPLGKACFSLMPMARAWAVAGTDARWECRRARDMPRYSPPHAEPRGSRADRAGSWTSRSGGLCMDMKNLTHRPRTIANALQEAKPHLDSPPPAGHSLGTPQKDPSCRAEDHHRHRPGQDDAVAILLALASPDEIDVLGITAVAGNVPLALTARNARMVCGTGRAPGTSRFMQL